MEIHNQPAQGPRPIRRNSEEAAIDITRPNREGSPALYGYVTGIPNVGPGTDIFYDNVRLTPNKK